MHQFLAGCATSRLPQDQHPWSLLIVQGVQAQTCDKLKATTGNSTSLMWSIWTLNWRKSNKTWLPDQSIPVAGGQHPFTSDSDSGATHSPYIAFVSVCRNCNTAATWGPECPISSDLNFYDNLAEMKLEGAIRNFQLHAQTSSDQRIRQQFLGPRESIAYMLLDLVTGSL